MENFWKKTAAGLLALLIVAGASPVAPFTKTAQKSVITASAESEIIDVDEATDFGEKDEIGFYEVNPGAYRLTADIELDACLIIPYAATIDLNGHSLKQTTESTNVISIISTAGFLTLIDSTGGGTISGGNQIPDNSCGAGVYVGGESTFIMKGGTITGNKMTGESYEEVKGGGVRVNYNSTFIMEGGCITGNTASGGIENYGGGVYISNSTFIMTGGEISENTASGGSINKGSNVYVEGSDSIFIHEGGTISANVDEVYIDNSVKYYDVDNTKGSDMNSRGWCVNTIAEHGTLTLSTAGDFTGGEKNYYYAGTNVSLTVTSQTGYKIKTIKVGDTEITPVNGAYSFTMPAEDVTVTAEFVPEFPADGILTIGNEYAFTPDEDGVYRFNITNATEGQALFIKGANGVIADIQSAHLKAGETYIIRVYDLPTIGDPGQAEVTWEKLTAYNINLPDSVENGAIKLYRVNYTALYNTTDTLALAGDEMAIVATPEEVCDLKELTVTAGGNPVELTKKESETNQGTIAYYSFIMPAEDVTVTAEFEKPISSASLTLGDDLGLNFYMSSAITDENAADYTVKFEGECLENEATLTKNESTDRYYATAHVCAKNLDKKITAKLYKGEEVICTTEYSVADYLEKAPETVTDEKALALIKATKAFGAMSADYFYEDDHDFSAAYNAYLTQSGLTDADIVNNAKNNYATEFTTDDAKISLVLDEKTAIRLYVKGVQPDGENLKPSKQANKDVYPSYYEIAGLTPDKLADEQTVTIGDKEYKFSALSWANRILNQENPSEKNVNMAKAVTAYYLAAHDYYVDQHTVDLSQLTTSYIAKDGDILTGTTDQFIRVNGVTVTLKDAEIQSHYILCSGNSTMILEGTNKAPIQIQRGTLIIDGEGSLVANGSSGYAGIGGRSLSGNSANLIINGGNITATGGSQAAGIGGNMSGDFGNITINGGTVTAIGSKAGCPGIGTGMNGGNYSKCGDITINGGTVTAIGTEDAPGIGSVYSKECGNITIADTVEKVTVTKGGYAQYCIGTDGYSQTKCGTITIGGNVYYEDGAYVNGGDTYLTQDTIVYEVIDLSKLTEDYTAKNGDILTGELKENVKISVADGATVTLKDVTINGVNDDEDYQWAGITCNGDAKLILEGTNTIKGFYWDYPGVYIAPEKTLTIDGTGSLNASSFCGAGIGGGNMINCGNITINGGTVTANGGDRAAGIGGGWCDSCGNIVINGGTVTANGGVFGAGIGSPDGATCGDITINGGTVTAKGGALGAGIGCAYYGACGNITIADTVTKVTATKGDDAPNSIGASSQGYCRTVTIADGANVEQN